MRRRALEHVGGVAVCPGVNRGVGGRHADGNRVVVPAGRQEVVRQVDGRGTSMELLPPRHYQIFVDRLSRECVPETELARCPVVFFEQLVRHTGFESRINNGLIHAGNGDERVDIRGSADDRSGRKDVDLFLT